MFNLSRYFSTLSFVLIAMAGGLLGKFYHELATTQLVHMAEDRNVAMTHVFRNIHWPRYGEFLRTAANEGLREAPQIIALHGELKDHMKDTDVIKAKVYNRVGMTVYSSDPRQIGENKANNPGFQAALHGQVASELTHRNTFDAYEGSLSDLDVISSYVPIFSSSGVVEGVFELYQNVTPFLAFVRKTSGWIAGGLLGVLTFLYLAQFLVVRRAQRIIRQQEKALEAANSELEDRVRLRTRELEAMTVSLGEEVAERRAAEERLEHLAHHDPLTGLSNRLLFNLQLEHNLRRAEVGEERVAVLFIDLDRFKDVNDTLGHTVGDELLKAVATRLQKVIPTGSTLARQGGDEFTCQVVSREGLPEALRVAERILEQLAEPFLVADHDLQLSGSIGVSLFPEDGATVEALVRNADTAMYRAKANGRNTVHVYQQEMTEYATERMRMERLLRRSIEKGELSLAYQPQVDGNTGEVTGAEALVRWNSPELGAVLPVRFIPLAEETGFIKALGEWVLREACRQVVDWDRQGLHLPRISVNVSVKQMERSNFVDLVAGVLAETGLAPQRLELELTESVIMAVEDAFVLLEKLRQQGVRLSVDDFGTGYSSLSYLKLLPIDKLKIDRAFVTGIGANQGDEAIIGTIVSLAHSLGLGLIAEGVETSAQAVFLTHAGCSSMQGYFYGKPMAADAFVQVWQGWKLREPR